MLGPLLFFPNAVAPLLAAIQPTNPSSFTLAVLAIIFGTSFHLLIRPGYGERPPLRKTLLRESRENEGLIRPRRVA